LSLSLKYKGKAVPVRAMNAYRSSCTHYYTRC